MLSVVNLEIPIAKPYSRVDFIDSEKHSSFKINFQGLGLGEKGKGNQGFSLIGYSGVFSPVDLLP